MTAVAAVAALALGAAIGDAQNRFEAVDQSAIAGVAGLRIITVRDAVLKRCYLVFLGDAVGSAEAAPPLAVDVDEARVARDRRLADLIHTFDQDRSAIPGTLAPNPFRYEWPAATAQLEFGLVVLDQEFARLERRLDRLAQPSRMAITAITVPCAPPPESRQSP